jgi:hypothetical protein
VSHAFYIKTGDTAPSVEATLKKNGVAIDLTDAASIRFKMRTALPLDEPAVIVAPATSGQVRYDWGATETDVKGVYDAEFEITWTGGGVQTVPSRGFIRVYIADDLD